MKGLLTLLVGLVAFTAAQADPQIYYYHLDQLGTPQALTDANQAVVWRADYEPFGQATVTLQNGINNPIRFPGQYYDAETGLHYNYFRDYNPSTGRYIESDPIGLQGGMNNYVYALNSPIRRDDPSGQFVPFILWGLGAAGAILGGWEIWDATAWSEYYAQRSMDANKRALICLQTGKCDPQDAEKEAFNCAKEAPVPIIDIARERALDTINPTDKILEKIRERWRK